jgi:cytochrome c oxidase assembly factor CtaG
MSLRALALNWRIDGPDATAFLVLVGAIGTLYLLATARGNSRDRRGRRWPRGRSVCFIAGLGVLVVDLYSGIGAQADERLSAHMLEHMVIWVIVAPLLAAGAPVRLAFYSLPRRGRRTLARWLHSSTVSAITDPIGSILLFSAALIVTHLPAIYGLALSNPYVHEAEHGLYLLTSLLVWAPLIGVDPVPHRPGPRGRFAWMGACRLPWSRSPSGSELPRTPSTATTSTPSGHAHSQTNTWPQRSCGQADSPRSSHRSWHQD